MDEDFILDDAAASSLDAADQVDESTVQSIDYSDLLTSIDSKLDTFITVDYLNSFQTHLDHVVLNCVYLALALFFFGAVRLLIISIKRGES